MRLIQFETAAGERRVGVVEGRRALEVQDASSVRVLALAAIEAGRDLTGEILARGQGEAHDYPALLREGRVLPPLDHEDPAHCLVTGTGRFTLVGEGGGTRFTWEEELAIPWWLGGPLAARVLELVWVRNLRNLRSRFSS